MRIPSLSRTLAGSRALVAQTSGQARRLLRRQGRRLATLGQPLLSVVSPLLQPLRAALAETRALRRRRGRRMLKSGQRLHIGLRELPVDSLRQLIPEFERALAAVPGVAWARVHPALKAVVVHIQPHRLPAVAEQGVAALPAALQELEAALLQAVDEVEAAHGVSQLPFPSVTLPEYHPGDWMPQAVTVAEMAMDIASIGASVLLRAVKSKALPREIDLVALLEVASNLPGARSFLERHVGIVLTELGLESAGALLNTLVHGEIGAANSVLHRLLRLAELRARRQQWQQRWEDRFCATRGRRNGCHHVLPRPRPLPAGTTEHYAAMAGLSSLGAFAGTLFATGKLGNADAALLAGMPKPARLARDAFGAVLGYRLARVGVMVMTPAVLRVLDRLDRVALPQSLLMQDAAATEAFLAAAATAGLHVVAVGGGPLPDAEMRRLEFDEEAAVRLLQREGHGVIFVAEGSSAGFAAADCGLSLWQEGDSLVAGAHLYAEGGLAQAAGLLQAVRMAREATEQAMRISLAEVVFGVALNSAGGQHRAARQMMTVVSSTSILAIANSLRLAQAVHWPAQAAGSEAAPPPWHRMTAAEVLASLDSSREGLSAEAAAARHLPPLPEPARWRQLLQTVWEELRNPMTPLLAGGAALSLLSGAAVDAALIASVMIINGIYGGAQRLHAERLIRALSRREAQTVMVRRSGERRQVCDDELVPGDVVELVAGDVVPADCRLLQASSLEVDESSLTGESLPVSKRASPSRARQVAERHSMIYEGTAVTAGAATAVVVAVGRDTEANRASTVAAGAPSPTGAGVEARLDALTELTAPLAAISGLVLASAERLRGRPVREVLSTAVSLAVAAVPEGLPLLAGLAQLAVAGRLSRRGALVRNPRAVEALGRVNVLCCDKTGTLTEGRIRLALVSDGSEAQAPDALDAAHRRILGVAMRASPSTSDGSPIPHLTDRALIEGAQQMQVGSHDGLDGWQRLHELPFASARGFHASLAQSEAGKLISVKGAPEVVLPRCRHWQLGEAEIELDRAGREELLQRAMDLAGQGYRVLAVAERPAHERKPVNDERVRNLTFHGFVAFADVLRPSAKAAVGDLMRAGVRVVMLTGDHPRTAASVAAELGLNGDRRVVTGAELDRLGDEELARLVPEVHVFARVTPAHKVRIVKAFQDAGSVIGMTGDGINDAQAIRLADVGIALGEHSTRAARRAADLVVTDGSIETIVGAVLEGRALWLSVRDAVSLLVGGNLGEIVFTLVGGLAGGESPLNARQLLLVNLLTDAVPALAVALRPPRGKTPEDLLRAGPETSLGKELQEDLAWRAGITAGAASAAWLAARLTGNRRGASTVALLALTGAQLAQTLVAGKGDRTVTISSLASLGALLATVETPGLSHFFGSRPLGPIGLIQATTAAVGGGVAQWLLPRAARGARRQLVQQARRVRRRLRERARRPELVEGGMAMAGG